MVDNNKPVDRDLERETRMSVENKIARLMRNTGPARFFIPVGIFLIIFGVLMFGFNTKDFVQTTGKITAVEEVTEDKNNKEYDVSFTYIANGEELQGTFSNLSGTFNVGDEIAVYYDPADPNRISNGRVAGFEAPLIIAAGIAAIGYGLFRTLKAFRKSKALDDAIPTKDADVRSNFDGYKNAPGVKEYYFRFDGNALKPGYIIEDADRKELYVGKMLKNSLVGARIFEFSDRTTGVVKEHEVGHTVTSTYNDEFFSAESAFKFDGVNIWDLLHQQGIRISTDMHSKFPYLIYEVTKDGAAFARIETSSIYVHEDEEAQHKIVIPYGKMYYRCWTDSEDLDLLFLTVFAITETEQAVVD